MTRVNSAAHAGTAARGSGEPQSGGSRFGLFPAYLGMLTIVFLRPLSQLVRFALDSDLHSHAVLVPLISGYLLFSLRHALPPAARGSLGMGFASGGAGGAVAAAAIWGRGSLSANDYLAAMALAFVILVAAGGFIFQGSKWMRVAAFPFAFLAFLAPLPDQAVQSLEHASTLASAEAAALYFAVAGTPLVRNGTVFELPGIVLQVARECSGIRSSWVLFITSVLAAHLFLASPWRRLVLVLFVIPLGILRNGFRVFVIGMLCVHIGPHMIDSAIHRHGGPLFFAMSLAPLFLLLWWLRRQERRPPPPAGRP